MKQYIYFLPEKNSAIKYRLFNKYILNFRWSEPVWETYNIITFKINTQPFTSILYSILYIRTLTLDLFQRRDVENL